MKYLNGPHGGWIGPQIFLAFCAEKWCVYILVFAHDGLEFNIPNDRASLA
jgi:hypothetical protein